MKVAEIFYSVQGEGINLGIPAVFVRVSGCNICCSKEKQGFDCDTSYALQEGKKMTVEQVADEISIHTSCNHVVVTGGEPTMQVKEIVHLMRLLPTHTFEVETNGYVEFDPTDFSVTTISPKKGFENTYFWHNIRFYKNVYFKFVVSNSKDFNYWFHLAKKLGIPKNKIIFMPEGIDNKSLKRRGLKLVELCKQNGVRFTPRIHIWLWGLRRGM